MGLIVETIHDLQRILDSRPDWRRQIRQSLFPKIDIPRAFQELADAQRRSDEKFEQLAEAQRRSEVLLHQLAEAQRRSEILLHQLTLRMDKLAEAQEKLTLRMDQLAETQQQLITRVDRLESKVDRIEVQLVEAAAERKEAAADRQAIKEEAAADRQAIKEEAAADRQAIRDDISVLKRNQDKIILRQDELRGTSYEGLFRNYADAIFGYFLRRGKVARNQIGQLLEEAEDNGQISEEEHEHVMASDLLWRGKIKSTKEEALLVVEVSWLAEKNDVERAVARANVLRRIGIKALPVVAGIKWVDELAKEAISQGVVMVTDKRLDKASWQAAVAAIS